MCNRSFTVDLSVTYSLAIISKILGANLLSRWYFVIKGGKRCHECWTASRVVIYSLTADIIREQQTCLRVGGQMAGGSWMLSGSGSRSSAAAP